MLIPRYPLIFAVLLAGGPVVWAQSDTSVLTPKTSTNPSPYSPPHSQFGFVVLDAKTGATLAENGAGRLLIPASVVKALATAMALDKMGADKVFPTVLYRTGKLENGILDGRLWIRGFGNPALGSERGDSSQRADSVFGRFAQAIKVAGIREIKGGVFGDASFLAPEPPARGALWEDVGNYYGATPTGLPFHDNQFVLELDGAPEKGHALSFLKSRPRQSGIGRLQIRAVTSAPGSLDSCFILGAFWNTPRMIVGTCPAGKQPLEIKGSLPDPAWTIAREFEDYLRAQGFTVGKGEARGEEPFPALTGPSSDTVRLAEHLSPPLLELMAATHGYSDNFYAAQLTALCGGVEAFRVWLGNQGAKGPVLHLLDGNGLSRQDRLTPSVLARLMAGFSRKPWFAHYRETLLGGKICPIRPNAYAEGLQGKLWIKTGSLDGVASLAGYIQGQSGRLLVFAIIANHFDESVNSVRNQWGTVLRSWQSRF